MGSGYVNVSTVECNLAAICLRYLTFECFDDDISPDKLRHATFEGMLSFQDYAVAKWLEHVRAIVKMTPDEFSTIANSQAVLLELEVAMDEFAGRYEDDVLQSPIIDMAAQDCKHFRNYRFYQSLLHIWSHIHRHHDKGSAVRSDISIKALSDALFRNRKLLEDLPSLNLPSYSVEKENLTNFYGERRFKCPRITCFFFHEGFKDARSRDQHINRHDRPFNCIFPDCSIAEFGFASNNDLEKHMRFFHPDIEGQANRFAAATKPTTWTQWKCNLCGKRFTRGFHQRNHLRSHTGERPFACSECGKAFTRANDCKRHEKIHARQ